MKMSNTHLKDYLLHLFLNVSASLNTTTMQTSHGNAMKYRGEIQCKKHNAELTQEIRHGNSIVLRKSHKVQPPLSATAKTGNVA